MVVLALDVFTTFSEDGVAPQRVRQAPCSPSSDASENSSKTARKLDFTAVVIGSQLSSRRQNGFGGVCIPRSINNVPTTSRSRWSVSSSPCRNVSSTQRQPLTPRGRTSGLVPKRSPAARSFNSIPGAVQSARDLPASHSLDTVLGRRPINEANVSPSTPRDGRGRPIGLAALGTLACPSVFKSAEVAMRTPRHNQSAGGNSSSSSNSSSVTNFCDVSVKGRSLNDRVPPSPRVAAPQRSHLSHRSRSSAPAVDESSDCNHVPLGVYNDASLGSKSNNVKSAPEGHQVTAGGRSAMAASASVAVMPSPQAPRVMDDRHNHPAPMQEQCEMTAHVGEALDDHKCAASSAPGPQPAMIYLNAKSTSEDCKQAQDVYFALSEAAFVSGSPRIGGLSVASLEQEPHLAGKLQLLGQQDPEVHTPWSARMAGNLEPHTPSPLPRERPPTCPPLPPWPMTPAKALLEHSSVLNAFEQSEVLSYPALYFLGPRANKVRGKPSVAELNHGYDDARGDYTAVVADHLAYRYEVMGMLGRGSFGQVMKCRDHADGSVVAVKIIRNKTRFHTQALVEVEILDRLRSKGLGPDTNIIRMLDSFYFRNHLCISFQLLSINLYEHIRGNLFRGFEVSAIRRIAGQLLVALQTLSVEKIVHCDLKPENILLNASDQLAVTVIDFGSSCFESKRMYTYIQSRYYRSPEVMFGLPYGPPIDMWSLGCILAELWTGRPLFPGENEQEQLHCIAQVLGHPSEALIKESPRRAAFFDDCMRLLPLPELAPGSRRKQAAGSDLPSALSGCQDLTFLHFLEGCLSWNPSLRLTPEAALEHPWITGCSPRQPAPVWLPTPDSPFQNYEMLAAAGEDSTESPRTDAEKLAVASIPEDVSSQPAGDTVVGGLARLAVLPSAEGTSLKTHLTISCTRDKHRLSRLRLTFRRSLSSMFSSGKLCDLSQTRDST